MSTRAVTRSYLAAFTLISATAIYACGGSSTSDGTGGSGGDATGEGGASGGDNGGGGDVGSGGASANGGSTANGGSGGSTTTGGTAGAAMTGGKGGTPATGGMGMGGAMMGTGGAVASTFPCKANCKVLVVGDGLAAGTGSGANGADGAGYRNTLKTRLGAAYTFVGAAGTPPHEGMKGRTVAALLTALPGLITMYKPDLIVINIGTEDAKANIASLTAPKVMAVVDKATELAPNAAVVVTSPPPFKGVNKTTLQAFSIALAKLVKASGAAGKHVDFSGLSSALIACVTCGPDDTLLSDVYPNAKGYAEIDQLIVGRVATLLKL